MPQTVSLGPCECCGATVDPPECDFCDGTPPATYYIYGLSGITDSSCAECEDYNESPLELQYSGTPCNWEWTGTGGCTGEEPVLTVNSDGSATLTIGGATYSVDPFDCSGLSTFSLDSAGTECDDWPEEIDVVPGIFEGCDICSGAAPAQYRLTISGASDGTCTDSAALNGEHMLDFSAAAPGVVCVWQKELELCGFPNSVIAVARNPDGGVNLAVQLDVGGSGTVVAAYREAIGSSANCLLPVTLELDNSGTGYNFPATVLLEAA